MISHKGIVHNLLFASCILLAACAKLPGAEPTATSSPSASETPTSVVTATPTHTPTPIPSLGSKNEFDFSGVVSRELFCPSEIEEARQAYNNGGAQDEQGNIEAAIESYREAIELDPTYCDAMDNLGRLLRRLGEYDEAVEWYKKSLGLSPENVVAHQNLAAAYIALEEFELAELEYQAIIDIEPENPEGYFGLGNIYINSGDPQNAITALETAEKLYEQSSSPFIVEAQYLLGLAHFLADDCTKAIEYLELTYTDYAFNPVVNAYLGYCYLFPPKADLAKAEQYLTIAQLLGFEVSDEILSLLDE